MAGDTSGESEKDDEETFVNPESFTVDKPRLGFHLPKIPRMETKPNAHEKLIEWKRYKRAIEYYFNLLPNGVSSSQKHQLLYLGGGPEIQKGLENFVIPNDNGESEKFTAMIEHLDEHFKTGVDGLAYMLQFFKMAQRDDETFADFAQRLKAHADLCEMGLARDNLIKTQIQKGAKNAKIFQTAEAWMNKSVNDLIALGIADEAGMSGNKCKNNKETSDDTETIAKIDSKPGPSRFPRDVRRNFRQGSSRPYGRGGQQFRNTQYGQRQNQYTTNQGQRPMPNNNIICYACEKTGHIARNCPNRKIFAVYDEDVKVNRGNMGILE